MSNHQDWEYCPNCNARYKETSDGCCSDCGKQASTMIYKCVECGYLSGTCDYDRCPQCGLEVRSIDEVDSQPGGPGKYRYFDPGAHRLNNRQKGCFIATAVYEDINHPSVCLLREYRDNCLSKSFSGKLFIKFYYLFSPYTVGVIKSNKPIKIFTKSIIDKIIQRIS